MVDDTGTHKIKTEVLKEPTKEEKKQGFSQNEIDTIADLINSDSVNPDSPVDPEDTGQFER